MSFNREEIINQAKSKWDKLTLYRESVFLKCAKDLKNTTQISIEIDHAKSLKEGGDHHPDNMWPLPKNINRTKSSKSWKRYTFESWKDWFQRRVEIDSQLLGDYDVAKFDEICLELKSVWTQKDAESLKIKEKDLAALTSRNIEYVLDGTWSGEVIIAGIKVYLNIISDKNVEVIIPVGTKLPKPNSANKNNGIKASCINPTQQFLEKGIIQETKIDRVVKKEILFKGSILKIYEFIVARDANGKFNCYKKIEDLNGNSLTKILNPLRIAH